MDGSLCAAIHYVARKNPYRIDCGMTKVRNITLVKEFIKGYTLLDMGMTICEVEVFSLKPPGEYVKSFLSISASS